MVQILITILAGISVALLGYFVKYGDRPGLIAGFEREKFDDLEGLKNFVGFYMFFFGFFTIITGFLDYLLIFGGSGLWTGYTVMLIVLLLRLVFGIREFE